VDELSLFNATPDEMALLGVILGFTLAKPLTINELNVFGNVLFEAGEILLVIAAQRTLIESINKDQEKQDNKTGQAAQKSSEDVHSKIEQLQQQIHQLQNQLEQLKKPR
jgi:predicted RNase H-like nuclease (RuvC/YqgF family)